MAQVSQTRADALQWVGDELAKSLESGGQFIESYIESPRGKAPLQRALAELKQVRGTLSMIRCFGVMVLVDETVSLLQDIIDGRVGDQQEAPLTVILSAFIQLTDCLDLVSGGMPDCVLVLQPLINELRAERGAEVATEVDLFLRQVESARPKPAQLPVDLSSRAAEQIVPAAKRFYPAFQTALLGWLQNTDVAANLRRLGKIAEQLHGLAAAPAVYELWWLYAAVIEGVLAGGIDATAAVKRLSGRMVQSLKALGNSSSEGAFSESDELYCRLLFQVQRSHSGGSREVVVRQAYTVSDLLPEESLLADWRARLRGPNTGLIAKLSQALREDLAAVRDGVDLAVRAGHDEANTDELVELCTHMSNTLAMLGLNELRRRLLSKIEILDNANAADGVTEESWAELATALVDIEQQLDYALKRQLRDGISDDADRNDASGELASQPRSFFDAGTAAIYRESLKNLARLRQLLDSYFEDGRREPPRGGDGILQEVEAGLGILGHASGKNAVARLRGLLAQAMPHFGADSAIADAVAESIASMEWYLNGLASHGEEKAPTTATVDRYLDALASALEAAAPAPPTSDVPAAAPARATAADDDDSVAEPVDPDIREIFIEEAADVLEELRRVMPQWSDQPDNQDLLAVVRRSFHTLKGSGRLVGAAEAGEFCWAMEQMLNRCPAGDRQTSDRAVTLVEQALKLLPELIDAFRDQRPGPRDAQSLAREADALASVEAGADQDADRELIEVFSLDARSRLQVVEQCLDQQAEQRPDLATLMRALHTIRGSAESANVAPISSVTGVLEDCLKQVVAADLGLDEEISQVIADWAAFMHTALDALNKSEPLPDPDALIARVEALETSLPFSENADDERAQIRSFTEDALDMLERCESRLDAWYGAPDDRQHCEAIAALMDSLSERARQARVRVFSRAGQAIAGRLRFNLQHPESAEPATISKLHDALDRLYDCLDRLRFGERVDDIEDIIAQFGPQPESGHGAVAEQAGADPANDGVTVTDEDAQASKAPEQGTEIDDQSAASEGEPAGDEVRDLQAVDDKERGAEDDRSPPSAAPNDEPNGVEVTPPEQPLTPEPGTEPHSRGAEEAPLSQPPSPSSSHAGDMDVDPELLTIFCEEAGELLESIDAAVADWERAAGAAEPPQTMQRLLHTLKGSARMARVTAVGDISHALESFITALDVREQAVEQADVSRVQRVVDLLHEAIDRVTRDGVAGDVAGQLAALQDNASKALTGQPTTGVSVTSMDAESGMQAQPRAPAPSDSATPQSAGEPHDAAQRSAELTEISVDEPTDSMAAAQRGNAAGSGRWSQQLFWRPQEDLSTLSHTTNESARVLVENLESMSNESGEISIFRSRLEQGNAALRGQLKEMGQAIARVNEQVRQLDAQAESSIVSRRATETGKDRYAAEFDPLELDRYTRMQELSRALSESLNDLSSLHTLMGQNTRETESLLLQQSRVNTALHERLMRALMIPFSRYSNRLQRVVRQTAEEYQRHARLDISGDARELDRNVLQRILGPIEHLLRNSVVHGIETPETRRQRGKPDQGTIHLALGREGSQLIIKLTDDGNGLDFEAIRNKAEARGLVDQQLPVDEEMLSELIFERGFTTASSLTQTAGRGVGMDVVRADIKQLGGTIHVSSRHRQGLEFEIRLPISLAVSQALIVRAGDETYAVPLRSVTGVIRIEREQWSELSQRPGATLDYGEESYKAGYLGDLIGIPRPEPRRLPSHVSMLLIQVGDYRAAIAVDQALGGRDIVMKSVGPQISTVAGVNGATIMPDGSVVLILDVVALLGELNRRGGLEAAAPAIAEVEKPATKDVRPLILVVDDSITVRRVSERFLTRNDYRVATARDGMDALAKLQSDPPALVLLDIEMPRIDGFEVATYIRNTAGLREIPIIMLTSRSGDKHRQRARQIGVDRYVIKPYQEEDLLKEITGLLSDVKVEALS